MARILALFSICFVLAGCELVADFDRSKIPQPDAGLQPTPATDAALPPIDAGTPDAALSDAAVPDAATSEDDAGLDDDAGAQDRDASR